MRDDYDDRRRGARDEPEGSDEGFDPEEVDGENPDEVGAGRDEPGREPRPRVRITGREGAKFIVRQYLERAAGKRSPSAVDAEGNALVDLCYQKADRPIRTFPYDAEASQDGGEGLAQVAEEVVDEAADVLEASGDAEGRYDVRVAGAGIRTFALRAVPLVPGSSLHSDPGSTAMVHGRGVVHEGFVEDEGAGARSLLRAATEQLASERERNDRLADLALQTMGVVLDAKQIEIRGLAKREKTWAKREKGLHKTINKLVKQRWETLDDREALAGKKHEREQEIREEQRSAEREDFVLAQLMDVGPKILAHLVAAKSPALAAIAVSMSSPAPAPTASGFTPGGARPGAPAGAPGPDGPDGPATPAAGESEEAAIMRVVHGFGSSIRPEQYTGMLKVLDPGQQQALMQMMQALAAHHEKHSQG